MMHKTKETSLKRARTLVVGIGEVGGALAEILDRTEKVLRHDIEPMQFDEPIGVMHLCIPYQSRSQFESAAFSYMERFRPDLTIINSTVVPGTTRQISERSGRAVAYSPVRGKHVRMTQDLLRYVKFVAAPDGEVAKRAEKHFRTAGLKTRGMSRVETLELAKLAETTYFGLLIGFAQELNRYAQEVGGDYSEAIDFFEEIDFLPRVRYFPGFIGGHCVVANIHLLKQVGPSPLFQAILDSNQLRAAELAAEAGRAAKREKTEDGYERKLLANR